MVSQSVSDERRSAMVMGDYTVGGHVARPQ